MSALVLKHPPGHLSPTSVQATHGQVAIMSAMQWSQTDDHAKIRHGYVHAVIQFDQMLHNLHDMTQASLLRHDWSSEMAGELAEDFCRGSQAAGHLTEGGHVGNQVSAVR
jgi:hypothetical protein